MREDLRAPPPARPPAKLPKPRIAPPSTVRQPVVSAAPELRTRFADCNVPAPAAAPADDASAGGCAADTKTLGPGLSPRSSTRAGAGSRAGEGGSITVRPAPPASTCGTVLTEHSRCGESGGRCRRRCADVAGAASAKKAPTSAGYTGKTPIRSGAAPSPPSPAAAPDALAQRAAAAALYRAVHGGRPTEPSAAGVRLCAPLQ